MHKDNRTLTYNSPGINGGEDYELEEDLLHDENDVVNTMNCAPDNPIDNYCYVSQTLSLLPCPVQQRMTSELAIELENAKSDLRFIIKDTNSNCRHCAYITHFGQK